MTITYPQQTAHWEGALLALAQEARTPAADMPAPISDRLLCDRAYRQCDAVIAEHGRTFYLASRLAPPAKRRAIRALYAFCRVTDDIVDCEQAAAPEKEAALAAWRARALSPAPPLDDLVAVALADTRRRYHVPASYCEQLIAGVARDLYPARYQTFADLATYAYRVASTVGIMSLRIIGVAPGCSEEEALPYAIKLGLALQLTNILRDVGEDWRAGRVYLPTDELAVFGLGDEDLARGQVDTRWRALMRFQIERARTLYREAWPCVAMFDRDGRFAVAAASALYRAILDDIEAHDYDVFHRRAHIGAWGKLRRLPGVWIRSR